MNPLDLGIQRRIDRILGVVLCGIFSLFPRHRKATCGPQRPRKILVILLSEMGSLVLARPMFARIRKTYPGAAVYVLLFEQNKGLLETLDIVPREDVFTLSNQSLQRLLGDALRVLIRLRRNRIDTVIDCELFARVSSVLSFLSGARIRVGFHPYTQEGLYRGNFINRPVLYNPYHHISHQFINLVEAIESDHCPRVKRDPTTDGLEAPAWTVTDVEIKSQRARFNADFPSVTGKRLILIYPGGGLLPIRAWPREHFVVATRDFLKNGFTVGIIGLDEDKELARAIRERCPHHNCIDLTGYTKSIRELLLMFHFGALLITNDGGPVHFASMTPIPTIVFFGPETPALYGSLSPKAFHFYLSLSCSPCLSAYNHRNSPCDGNNLCLQKIPPEDVLKKAYEMLKTKEDNQSTNFSRLP
jgi:ADP-heptose:LPS heptosyltransferase